MKTEILIAEGTVCDTNLINYTDLNSGEVIPQTSEGFKRTSMVSSIVVFLVLKRSHYSA